MPRRLSERERYEIQQRVWRNIQFRKVMPRWWKKMICERLTKMIVKRIEIGMAPDLDIALRQVFDQEYEHIGS